MKKALVIQEDIIILKILENLMRLKNFDCKAIRTLSDLDIEDQTVNYNIIISDILFDGIAPLDFVFQIQEIIMHESLIIVSNMGQKKVQQEVLASENVNGFFSVPIDMDKIEQLIT